MISRRSLLAGLTGRLTAGGRDLTAGDLYVNGVLSDLPGRVQRLAARRGLRVLYAFFPNGRLDVLECGLVFDFGSKQLHVALYGAFRERGTWRLPAPAEVMITVPCPRFPTPPGAPACREPQTFALAASGRGPGRFGRTLTSPVNPNGPLVTAPAIENLGELLAFLG